MRMRFVVKILAVFASLLFLLLLYLYYSIFIYRVAITNQTSLVLTNVEIMMPDRTVWQGRLNPGESHTAYATVRREGGLVVAFSANGRGYRGGVDYVAGGISYNEYITVTPTLQIEPHSDHRYRFP